MKTLVLSILVGSFVMSNNCFAVEPMPNYPSTPLDSFDEVVDGVSYSARLRTAYRRPQWSQKAFELAEWQSFDYDYQKLCILKSKQAIQEVLNENPNLKKLGISLVIIKLTDNYRFASWLSIGKEYLSAEDQTLEARIYGQNAYRFEYNWVRRPPHIIAYPNLTSTGECRFPSKENLLIGLGRSVPIDSSGTSRDDDREPAR